MAVGKTFKTAETKEMINFLSNNFNSYEIPEKIKSYNGGALISKNHKKFSKNRNLEIEYCTPRLHTGNGTVQRTIQTLKNVHKSRRERTNGKHKSSGSGDAFHNTYRIEKNGI